MGAWTDVAGGWWSWMASLSIQFALLAVLFALADRVLARRGPTAVRAALSWALLLRIVLPTDVTSPITVARILGDVPARASVPSAALDALFVAWILGVASSAAVLLVRSSRARRAWLSGTTRAPALVESAARRAALLLGTSTSPLVRVSARARGPASVGLFRPVIVVPVAMTGPAAASRLQHVLLHELAHVFRRDALAACAWDCARALLWFHPLVHLAARRAATLREIACDERAARAIGGARAYRSTLLELARPFARSEPAGASAFLPPEAQILARLAALDRPFLWSRGRECTAGIAAFTLVAACCVPLARPTLELGRVVALPALDDLDGCLRKRFAVMVALATEPSSPTDRP